MKGVSSPLAVLKQLSAAARVTRVKRTKFFTKKRKDVSLDADATRLIGGLEAEFDLMRLRRYRTDLEQNDARLAKNVEILNDNLRSPGRAPGSQAGNLPKAAWLRRWWHVLVSRGKILWLESRRRQLVEEQRRCLVMEEDIRFGMRLVGVRLPSDPEE